VGFIYLMGLVESLYLAFFTMDFKEEFLGSLLEDKISSAKDSQDRHENKPTAAPQSKIHSTLYSA
jgi:hypothetical protein